MQAEAQIDDFLEQDFEAIVLPGGLIGARNFRESKILTRFLLSHASKQQLIAAICASPQIVLYPL